MQINKLSATFGKLDGDTLELHGGLNVICAPNESGKSTWCAFIRAMLYGVDSSERQRNGYLPDKMRYAPWSGAAMQGTMELSAGGRDICLIRKTKQSSAPMREFSAVYSGTNIPVEGMTGLNAGQMLTGVGREVFRRSAFVEQGAVAVSGSPELEKRISAIVSTGEEDCSFTEADDRLRAWQRKRRYNKRGRLPELEARMSETKSRLSGLEEAARERDSLSAELERAKGECSRLETADDERDACRAALCGSVIGERSPEDVRPEVAADIENSLTLKAEAEKKISAAPAIICLILALIAAAAGIFLSPYAYAAAALLCIIAVLLFVRQGRAKAAAYEAGKQRRRILSKYKAENEDDIKTCEAEYLELYERFRQAEAEEKAAAGRLEEMRRHQEQTEDMAAQEAGMSVFLITDCMINRENKDISVYPHGSFEQLAEYVKKNK